METDHDRDEGQRDAEGEERKGASDTSYGHHLASQAMLNGSDTNERENEVDEE